MSAEGKGESPGGGEIRPEQREAFRKRSNALGKRLDEVNARRNPPQSGDARARGEAFARAFRFVAELLVGVGVGGFIGWVLDRQLGTAPWLLVLFVTLGFAAGLMNVIRAAQKAQADAAASQLATPSVKDDDEDDR
ncbi:MAG TPA: AtpZ/AtpI family protein [Hyphomicrobium sp.]|jgi:ATP synthase protein I